jgi:hypothetical protein
MVRLQRWGSSPVNWRVQRPEGGDKVVPADALTDEEINLAIEEANRFKKYHAERPKTDPHRAGLVQFEQNILMDLQTILEKRARKHAS